MGFGFSAAQKAPRIKFFSKQGILKSRKRGAKSLIA
jgi:hypothetical protein